MRGAGSVARGIALLVVLLAGAGCASLQAGGRPGEYPAPPARPGASPEYEFLVGRDLELEGNLPEALNAYSRAVARDPESAFLHRKVAQLAARLGRMDDALEHAERAHELDPEDADTRMLLGTLYRVRRELGPAERVLRSDDGEPLRPDAAFLLYTIYVEADRLAEALATAEWLVEREPEVLRGYFALAGVYEKMEQPEAMERALRQALEIRPGNLAVYGTLAQGRRARGNRAGEIEIYREILEQYPHHQATLVGLADALVSLQRTDEAIEVLREVEQYHPGDTRSRVRLALLEYERGNNDEAALLLQEALDADPDEHGIAYFLGLVRQRQGDQAAAIEAFESVASNHQRYANARTQLAVIYEKRREYHRALEEVERAREQEPSRELDLYRASLQAKTGDFDGALAFLEGLLGDDPDDQLLYNLGVLYGEAKDYERALRYMQLALEKNPDNPAVLNYIGYSWAERGERLDEAEAMISRALELRPDDGFITDSLGWVYYMRARPLLASSRREDVERGRGLLERAVRELERAVQLTDGDPVITEHLGDAYLLQRDKQRALELYEDALRRDPRDGEQPELKRKFERLRLELGAK